MKIEQAAKACRGTLFGAAPGDVEFVDLTTDSRASGPGKLFLALRGEKFDGNDFIDDAVARGARAIVCNRGKTAERKDVTFIEVDDTELALGDIANAHRREFSCPVVAITGSNGKTTTKELLRAILTADVGADRVLANEGNLNNLIGLPLTAMKLNADHAYAIFEMGMNAPGEIDRLTEIADPDVGAITCVAEAHLEGLGSIDGVKRAKGELFVRMRHASVAIVNGDDERVLDLGKERAGPKIVFGQDGVVRDIEATQCGLSETRLVFETPRGCATTQLPLVGRHNVQNALAAIACAEALDIDIDTIADGLTTTKLPPMRMAVVELPNGVTVVDDGYNANPSSLDAALATVSAGAPGRTMVAVGDMRELGLAAAEIHARAGRRIAEMEPVFAVAVGEHAQDIRDGAVEGGMGEGSVVAAASHEEAAVRIAERWTQGDTVLVKGSRGATMERVVVELRRLAGS